MDHTNRFPCHLDWRKGEEEQEMEGKRVRSALPPASSPLDFTSFTEVLLHSTYEPRDSIKVSGHIVSFLQSTVFLSHRGG